MVSPSSPEMEGNSEVYIDDQTPADKEAQIKDMPSGKDNDAKDED